jgi:hypothetical protein
LEMASHLAALTRARGFATVCPFVHECEAYDACRRPLNEDELETFQQMLI